VISSVTSPLCHLSITADGGLGAGSVTATGQPSRVPVVKHLADAAAPLPPSAAATTAPAFEPLFPGISRGWFGGLVAGTSEGGGGQGIPAAAAACFMANNHTTV
jgi:hypothetical protein